MTISELFTIQPYPNYFAGTDWLCHLLFRYRSNKFHPEKCWLRGFCRIHGVKTVGKMLVVSVILRSNIKLRPKWCESLQKKKHCVFFAAIGRRPGWSLIALLNMFSIFNKKQYHKKPEKTHGEHLLQSGQETFSKALGKSIPRRYAKHLGHAIHWNNQPVFFLHGFKWKNGNVHVSPDTYFKEWRMSVDLRMEMSITFTDITHKQQWQRMWYNVVFSICWPIS